MRSFQELLAFFYIPCRRKTVIGSCGDYRKLNEVIMLDRYSVPFLKDSTHFHIFHHN